MRPARAALGLLLFGLCLAVVAQAQQAVQTTDNSSLQPAVPTALAGADGDSSSTNAESITATAASDAAVATDNPNPTAQGAAQEVPHPGDDAQAEAGAQAAVSSEAVVGPAITGDASAEHKAASQPEQQPAAGHQDEPTQQTAEQTTPHPDTDATAGSNPSITPTTSMPTKSDVTPELSSIPSVDDQALAQDPSDTAAGGHEEPKAGSTDSSNGGDVHTDSEATKQPTDSIPGQNQPTSETHEGTAVHPGDQQVASGTQEAPTGAADTAVANAEGKPAAEPKPADAEPNAAAQQLAPNSQATSAGGEAAAVKVEVPAAMGAEAQPTHTDPALDGDLQPLLPDLTPDTKQDQKDAAAQDQKQQDGLNPAAAVNSVPAPAPSVHAGATESAMPDVDEPLPDAQQPQPASESKGPEDTAGSQPQQPTTQPSTTQDPTAAVQKPEAQDDNVPAATEATLAAKSSDSSATEQQQDASAAAKDNINPTDPQQQPEAAGEKPQAADAAKDPQVGQVDATAEMKEGEELHDGVPATQVQQPQQQGQGPEQLPTAQQASAQEKTPDEVLGGDDAIEDNVALGGAAGKPATDQQAQQEVQQQQQQQGEAAAKVQEGPKPSEPHESTTAEEDHDNNYQADLQNDDALIAAATAAAASTQSGEAASKPGSTTADAQAAVAADEPLTAEEAAQAAGASQVSGGIGQPLAEANLEEAAKDEEEDNMSESLSVGGASALFDNSRMWRNGLVAILVLMLVTVLALSLYIKGSLNTTTHGYGRVTGKEGRESDPCVNRSSQPSTGGVLSALEGLIESVFGSGGNSRGTAGPRNSSGNAPLLSYSDSSEGGAQKVWGKRDNSWDGSWENNDQGWASGRDVEAGHRANNLSRSGRSNSKTSL